MTSTRDVPVLIVGAGPTGLLTAIWLSEFHIPFRIIDKASGPGQTSRAIVVHARTLEFYQQLGFADEIVERAVVNKTLCIREAGVAKGTVPMGEYGKGLSPFPFNLSFPQHEHEQVLLAQLEKRGGNVEWNTELKSYEQNDDHVIAVIQKQDAEEETITVEYVAGCDGAKSKVRSLSSIGLPGGTYGHVFFVADADVTGEAASKSLDICFTGGDFCVVIPLDKENGSRLIGFAPDGIAVEDVRFEHVKDIITRNSKLEVQNVRWFSAYRVHHRVASSFQDGRVFVAGDAAHLHSPLGGQGMNTGLGDATNLAWKLAWVVSKRAPPELLHTYESDRLPFAQLLVKTTDQLFMLVQNQGIKGMIVRRIILPYICPLLFKLSWIPPLFFRKSSQIDIQYRDSPLSSGAAGKVKAGDRLPWVQSPEEEGEDNFEALHSLEWQIHVFGTPTAEIEQRAKKHGVAVHIYPWSQEAKHKGFAMDSVYLVRPDGYVGFAGPQDSVAELEEYIEKWGAGPL